MKSVDCPFVDSEMFLSHSEVFTKGQCGVNMPSNFGSGLASHCLPYLEENRAYSFCDKLRSEVHCKGKTLGTTIL